MEGHSCDITMGTAGFGNLSIQNLPVSMVGELHNHSARCSMASHDVPVTGHIPTSLLRIITGMPLNGTRFPDVRVCKTADGYIIHGPLGADNVRGLYSIVSGSALHVDSEQPGHTLEGHCSIYCVKPPTNGEAYQPIVVDLHDHLHEQLQRYTQMPNQGGVTQDDLRNCVGRVSRLTSVEHIGACLRALSPLTTAPRIVFQTRGENPTVMMGMRCPLTESTRIKGVFMGWLEEMGASIYDFPVPSDDAPLRTALALPQNDRLWIAKIQGGLYIYDRVQGTGAKRLRSIVNSRDFDGGCLDRSQGSELQAHTFSHIGRLQFIVQGGASECGNSTLDCVGVPIGINVQTALMFVRNGFAQYVSTGFGHDPFHTVCVATVHGPGVTGLDPGLRPGCDGGC